MKKSSFKKLRNFGEGNEFSFSSSLFCQLELTKEEEKEMSQFDFYKRRKEEEILDSSPFHAQLMAIPKGTKCLLVIQENQQKGILYPLHFRTKTQTYFTMKNNVSNISVQLFPKHSSISSSSHPFVHSSFFSSSSFMILGTFFHMDDKDFFSTERLFSNSSFSFSLENNLYLLSAFHHYFSPFCHHSSSSSSFSSSFSKRQRQNGNNPNVNLKQISFFIPDLFSTTKEAKEKVSLAETYPIEHYRWMLTKERKKNEKIVGVGEIEIKDKMVSPISFPSSFLLSIVNREKNFISRFSFVHKKRRLTEEEEEQEKQQQQKRKEEKEKEIQDDDEDDEPNLFRIQPDLLQNDIYYVWKPKPLEYVGICLIPSFEKSKEMNSIFRSIKENTNLDLIEESDNEEEEDKDNEQDAEIYKREEEKKESPPQDSSSSSSLSSSSPFPSFVPSLAESFYCSFHEKSGKWIPMKRKEKSLNSQKKTL